MVADHISKDSAGAIWAQLPYSSPEPFLATPGKALGEMAGMKAVVHPGCGWL